jgi:phosphoribosylformylglycinamidine synthase
MVLAVPRQKVDELMKLSSGEDVEATVIGHFGTDDSELILKYKNEQVGRMSMHFLHNGIPMPTRRAIVPPREAVAGPAPRGSEAVKDRLLQSLAHPNIASKHWIIRQYDHEVQGGSVIKPLTGPLQTGPSDAAVIRPKLDSTKGVALACGMAPQISDPYAMTVAAIDEAIRNVVAVGADPSKIAILDNFCWPSVDDELTMGTLVAACEACRDAALAYGIPFISGKDSLHNQFTNQETREVIRIPRTLLISAIGVIDDVRRCVTMDLKKPGAMLALIRPKTVPGTVFSPEVHQAMADLIARGHIASCHDVSNGGVLVAAAEMCIASGLGIEYTGVADFDEHVGWYLIETKPANLRVPDTVELVPVGWVIDQPKLIVGGETILVSDLTSAWRGTLDW